MPILLDTADEHTKKSKLYLSLAMSQHYTSSEWGPSRSVPGIAPTTFNRLTTFYFAQLDAINACFYWDG